VNRTETIEPNWAAVFMLNVNACLWGLIVWFVLN
jgi:hypothetical protein